MKTSTFADIAAAATIALLMTAPDAMAAPVVEQAPVGPNPDANGNFIGSWAKEGDRAFALHAATVAEPAGFALMGLALAGAAGATLHDRKTRQANVIDAAC